MASKFVFSAGATLPEQVESVADAIAFITRYESPLLTFLGFPGNLADATNVKHEHQEDALLPNSSTVTPAVTDVATTVNVAAGTGGRFRAGQVLQVDGSRELILVSSVATDALTVAARSYRGSPGTAIANNAVIRVIQDIATDDETAGAATPQNRSRVANWTEIFREIVDVTRTAELVDLHGNIENEREHQIMMKKRELIRRVAHTIIRGRAQVANPEGTSSQARTMDGIIPRITGGSDPTNIDALGGALTEDLLNQVLEDMFTKGGKPGLLVCPPAQRRRLSALMEGRQRFKPEDSILGSVVEGYTSDFGDLEILAPDIFVPVDCLMVLDTSKIILNILGGYQNGSDPFSIIDLGRSGLATRQEVVTELTLELHNAGTGGHGLLQNLAFN